MEPITAIKIAKSLLELGKELAKVVDIAMASPDVVKRALLFLEVAKAAVEGLGAERQQILSDARRCNANDTDEVNALWTRLDLYLHENNIRPKLENSIGGLRVCRDEIEKKAEAAWWRKANKEAAVKEFTATLDELDSELQGLTSDFYPGGSAMGIDTLVPIFELISKVREDMRIGESVDIETIHEKLGELTMQAVIDKSHEE